jgi:hypothetical protein
VVEHLTNGTCERACYKCLKEFWNQRAHHLLDKRLVLTAMRTLADSGRTPRLEGPEDVRFESFLEARFYRLLQDAGLPLPKTQEIIRSRDSQYIIRADFRYERPPFVILTDGRAFHGSTEMQVIEDLDKRNALEFAGKRLLEFMYADVIDTPEAVIATVGAALSGGADGVANVEIAAERAGLSSAAQRFAARLNQADSGLIAAPVMRVDGCRIGTLAADPGTRRVVLLVDAQQWISDADTWTGALRLHNRLRLAGWRVVRVPDAWRDSPQGDRLIESVTRCS